MALGLDHEGGNKLNKVLFPKVLLKLLNLKYIYYL